MTFLEQRLNDAIARGSSGGPVASRLKSYVSSGALSQQHQWVRPLHRYDISHGIKTAEDFESVRSLWYIVFFGGPYSGFRFKDWADYQATQANTSLVLISGSDWQLCRRYALGAASYNRIIQKPVAGSVTVYRTRSGSVSTASATVNAATGVAAISGHVAGDTYTWTGEFDVPVTFADDAMDDITVTGLAGAELLGLPSIRLEEIRL